MNLKIKIFLIAILIGVISCLGLNVVNASEITSVFNGETISRDTLRTMATTNVVNSNVVAKIMGITSSSYQTNNGEVYWRVVDTSEGGNSKDLYCLNLARGFGAPNGSVYGSGENLVDSNGNKIAKKEYKTKYNLNTLTSEEYQNYTGLSATNKSKVLWILNNSITSVDDIKTILSAASEKVEEAGWTSYVQEDMKNNNDSRTALTFDDIKIVQQIALWHYTNPGSVFDNTISGICDSEGRQISSQGVNIPINTDTYNNSMRSGLIKQEKLNALYRYFIDGAEKGNSTTEIPTLTFNNSTSKVVEEGQYFIVGPFSLNGTNTSLIKEINASVNKKYTLLNSSKNAVANNDFKRVIGNNFYLKIAKSEVTRNTEITIDLTYKYDKREATLFTNVSDPTNTQPIVLIQSEEKTQNINTKAQVEVINVEVVKVWDDNNNQDGKRPTSIKVQLFEGDVKKGNPITLNESNNNWSYSWGKLLKGGKVYSIKELDENNNIIEDNGKNNNYTVKYSPLISIMTVIGEEVQGTKITNIYTPEKINVSGTKTWQDNNNQDGKRPESITINLLANGIKVKEITITSQNNWKYSFTNLPKYEKGKEIVYTVTENTVANYTTTINGFNITNSYVPEKIQKTVTKIWDDNNNQDGKRAEYGVTLKADGVVFGEEIKLTPDKTTYTWKDLPKYKDGREIVYEVEETNIPSEYAVSYSEDTFTITNKYTPGVIQKTVTKIWDDNNNQDGKRAEYGVTLKADGQIYGEEIKLTPDKTTYTWTNLPKYKDGKEIVYTVEETKIPQDYVVSYSKDKFTITNKYVTEKVSKKVIKVWNDQEDKDEKRPSNVVVKLYKNIEDRKTEVDSQRLDKSNNWMYTWNDLPGKENGKNIIYSVEENPVEKYTTTYSAENYSNTDEITITNTYIPVEITGKYNIILRKTDKDGNILKGSKFEISGKEYDLTNVGEVTIFENQEIKSADDINITYSIKETEVPKGYIGIESDLININAKVQKVDNNYKLTRADLVDSEGNVISNENIIVKLENDSIVIIVKNKPIEKVFDLALRKFITQVNDEQYSREPKVDTSTIENTKTATYKHTKEPIPVQKGDIVTYTIRVYNEGELDGYVDKITDYLPENLIPILSTIEGIDSKKYKEEIEFNENWLWIYENNILTTTITSKSNSETYAILTGKEEITDTKLNAFVKGSDKLDYIDVQIKCLVSDSATDGEYLTNIAEITDGQDINGIQGDGIDSTLRNVKYDNLSDYKNNEAINSTSESYIIGQEDDDDFEKLVVKEFDLALRKFITKVNETSYSREPVVDTSKLRTQVNGKTITTATYNHSKAPVIVETGDLVTYKIRIYNEGTIAGFANEITDNIPVGLEFLPNSSVNVSYKWKMLDASGKETEDVSKATLITTDYLSDNNKNNIIGSVSEENGQKVLKYKDVEVQFKVIAKAQHLQDNIIINEAQISADSDRDIDSNPTREEKYNYTTNNNEDDIDYEPIKLQYFDLALRKFVTKVNETPYNNRYPEVVFNEDGSIKYNHTKDPVLVTTGDTVIYTIRVYNEGEKVGTATEIKDNLPEGLAFDPKDETNKKYGWKMLDKDGNVTEDAEAVIAFSTDYLKSESISPIVKENGTKILSYKDVEIAFIVTESNLSDKIIVNTAQISADSNDDIDSIPNNDKETEDDIDKEYIRVEYFDLSLKKWVTETRVTLDGKTTINKTEFDEDSNGIAKVDIVAKKLNKTNVKFVYSIKVTNEGELPGYAYEIKDYIPKGLEFVAEDNEGWEEIEDRVVVTDKLKDTLLDPGESATVEIVLTWKNSSTNLGVKTNYAEISEDSAEDIDSIPDNYDYTEDDMDDAKVILSIKTAGRTTYIGLVLISITILAGGVLLIKKYVLD